MAGDEWVRVRVRRRSLPPHKDNPRTPRPASIRVLRTPLIAEPVWTKGCKVKTVYRVHRDDVRAMRPGVHPEDVVRFAVCRHQIIPPRTRR